MAVAVTAVAAPLLLLAFSALLNDSNLPDPGGVPSSVHLSPAEKVLHDVLASQRSAEGEITFRLRRVIAERFTGITVSHLRRISPLFAGATVEHDGGAYEHTRVSNVADFDMYTMLSAEPLREFSLRSDGEGGFVVQLRPGADRDQLPKDLVHMLTVDGRVDAGKFHAWMTECVLYALREAAEEHPDLRPVVYQTRGAPGVNLTDYSGANIEVDLTAKLPVPPAGDAVLRPAALRPCGTPLVPPGGRPVWYLYPGPARSGGAESFSANAPQLEMALLETQPLLQRVIRLLKTLSSVHDWHDRFRASSFQLKQAAFWWHEEHCAETRLLPASVGVLRQLEEALRARRLEQFWFAVPTEYRLREELRAAKLADEVAQSVEVLTSGDAARIRQLFRM
ncbi:hypothetical protein FJT64_013293 [Amphibalanus amphitrite]|uniref:Uncharacterized protein n=1 Tax=Amphibalanus amphitrite TaxID=1232801 RepID=A0A6A4V0R5_AMPAM|nr:hypothetical protein FJT64_013293 [Amphibalanus amphitrite]